LVETLNARQKKLLTADGDDGEIDKDEDQDYYWSENEDDQDVETINA